MKTLPLQFTLKTHRFIQLARTEHKALYRQEMRETGTVIGFEVIRVRVAKPYSIGGVDIEGGEFYPGAESWGQYGWTEKTRESADARYAAL